MRRAIGDAATFVVAVAMTSLTAWSQTERAQRTAEPRAQRTIATSAPAQTSAALPTSAVPTAAVATPANAAIGASADFDTRFGVVAERNMFLRDRIRRPTGPASRPSDASNTPPATPEQLLVLRGIVIEDELFRAYFENSRTGEVVRAAAGEALARGHVAEISIDAVAFEGDRGLTWIGIGDNLAGVRVSSTGVRASAIPAVSADGTPVDPATLSVEERMRLRRQQRTGATPAPSATPAPQ